MKKSTKIVIATAMILGISGGVFAFGNHGHWGMSPEDKAEFVTERVTKKLELRESQQQNLQVLVGDVLVIMKEIRAERDNHKAKIEQMLAEPVLDQGKALQLIESKTRQINDKAPEVIASLALFLDSLDSSQKSQLQSIIAKGMHHRHGHSEHDRD